MTTRAKALARSADGHRMNKTEGAWNAEIGRGVAWWNVGHDPVTYWSFEGVTLRIGHNTRYTPDFMLVLASGHVEFHEVKGFWRDDARVKIKAAAHQFPMFRFLAVQKKPKKDGGGWAIEEIKP